MSDVKREVWVSESHDHVGVRPIAVWIRKPYLAGVVKYIPEPATPAAGDLEAQARELRLKYEHAHAKKLEAARVGIMAKMGELHEHLALAVRYLEEETRDGDGIREEHFAGYQAALSVLKRTATNEPQWENAQLEIHDLLRRASEVPGLSAALDEANAKLAAETKARWEAERNLGHVGQELIETRDKLAQVEREREALLDVARQADFVLTDARVIADNQPGHRWDPRRIDIGNIIELDRAWRRLRQQQPPPPNCTCEPIDAPVCAGCGHDGGCPSHAAGCPSLQQPSRDTEHDVACDALATGMRLPADHPQRRNLCWLAGRAQEMLGRLAQAGAAGGVIKAKCWCAQCNVGGMMNVCPDCGNKRCQRAEWHGYVCTGSNEPGQVGKEPAPDAESKDSVPDRTDNEGDDACGDLGKSPGPEIPGKPSQPEQESASPSGDGGGEGLPTLGGPYGSAKAELDQAWRSYEWERDGVAHSYPSATCLLYHAMRSLIEVLEIQHKQRLATPPLTEADVLGVITRVADDAYSLAERSPNGGAGGVLAALAALAEAAEKGRAK